LVDDVLGKVRLGQGDNDAAAQLFTDGLAVARRAQDWLPLQEGLALAAEAGDETSAAYYLEVLAGIAGQQDNPQRAARLFAAARSRVSADAAGRPRARIGACTAPRFRTSRPGVRREVLLPGPRCLSDSGPLRG
jgi:hypothetical protein